MEGGGGGGGEKGTVCVTGGTGYIASWLIMNLLRQGYTVRATDKAEMSKIRSYGRGILPEEIAWSSKQKKAFNTQERDKHALKKVLRPEHKKDPSYLTTLPGALKNLQIINADLNKPDTFSAAISGCSDVFHLAHPIDLGGLESDEVITKRALEGTLGILQAFVDSKTVKRVVYTSSAVTVMFRGTDQGLTDERFWSDVKFYKEKKLMLSSYVISKTKTEMVVLEFADKHGLDVVSVIPSLVVGPFICPNLPSSVFMGMAMIFGKQEMYMALAKPNLVHVDDVANAPGPALRFRGPKATFGNGAFLILKKKKKKLMDKWIKNYLHI
ncbi:hypothetical protein ACSBR2_016874 [Camellia fascicularis]